jgi:Ca2+-binding EF-hand superfamily protein
MLGKEKYLCEENLLIAFHYFDNDHSGWITL